MKKLLVAITVSLVSATAMAQDKGWYVGGALGQVKAKDFCNGLTGGSTTCEDTDTTVKALGGYQASRNFAIEFGAMNAGSVDARNPVGRLTVDTKLAEATAVGILPVGQTFSVFGKFGLYTSAVDSTLSVLGGNRSESKTNSDLTYGAGVSWLFMPRFAVRAEWQRYSKVDGGDIGKSDADVVSLGLVYRFF
jgi:OOP family OmpA-OmpF porin